MTQRFIAAITPPSDRAEPTLWFAFAGNKLLYSEQTPEVVPLPVNFSKLGLEVACQHYLGTFDDQPCFAVELTEPVSVPKSMVLHGLRKAYTHLGDELFVVAGRAIQIIDWDRTHQFCGRCGAKTVNHARDRAKECPACKLLNYPRLSPAIIVAVRCGDKLLLARNPGWPAGSYSVLAGFVEPGETLEQAVKREVMEEVGILVKNIKYFGSQPWPFPNSLMLGFTAEYESGELKPDPLEIEDAKWCTVDDIPRVSSKISRLYTDSRGKTCQVSLFLIFIANLSQLTYIMWQIFTKT